MNPLPSCLGHSGCLPAPPKKEGSKQVIIGFKSQVKSKNSSETWKQGELAEVLEGESTVENCGASEFSLLPQPHPQGHHVAQLQKVQFCRL